MGEPESNSSSHSHVHQLVQDDRAKCILLNVPLPLEGASENCSGSSRRGGHRPATSLDAAVRRQQRDTLVVRVPGSGAHNGAAKSRRRVRSASVGRDRRADAQARYWGYLFENLRRAVDDLYDTCEADDSAPAAKEVVLVLENYVRDFKNLVGWFQLKRDYESTPPPQRPNSLTWEVRKTSPAAKLVSPVMMVPPSQRLLMAVPARRALNFEEKKEPLQTHPEHQESDLTPSDDSTKAANATKDSNVSKGDKAPQIEKEHKEGSDKTEENKNGEPQVSVAEERKVEKRTVCEKSKDQPTEKPVDKAIESVGNIKASHRSSSRESSKSARPDGNKVSSASSVSSLVRSQVNSVKATSSPYRSKTAAAAPKSTRPISSGGRQIPDKNSTSNPDLRRAESIYNHENKTSKPARVSLVARQSLAASSNSSSRIPLTRAATTTNISRASRNNVARTVTSSAAGRSTKTPLTTQSSLPSKQSFPSGSTSSVNSTGSCRSWADTVKGLRSSEDLTKKEQLQQEQLHMHHTSERDMKDDDEDGWETVRSRARSRISPLNRSGRNSTGGTKSGSRQVSNKLLLQKRESLDDAKLKLNYSPKTRFSVPSSAASLPSLAILKDEQKETGAKEQLKKNKKGPEQTKNDMDKKQTRLEKLAESKSNSSSESLSEKSFSKKIQCPPDTSRKVSVAAGKVKRPLKQSVVQKSDVKSKVTQKALDKRESSNDVKDVAEEKPEKSEDADSDATDSAIAKNKVAIAKATEEEEMLAREIRETEKQELSENEGEDSASGSGTTSSGSAVATPRKLEVLREGMSWAEEIELEEQIYEQRYPGRAIQLHEKLSSPARKKEPQEAFRRHQEKQKQARLRREKFQDEKASRLNALNARIQEVIVQKDNLMAEQKDLLEEKMRKAEEKRQRYIDSIRAKAHAEETKLKEIAFINELQAQNFRIDQLAHNQTEDERTEERLAELAEERARKVEEREAKEARAEERRRQMEAARLQNMEALRERIRTKEERTREGKEQARKERAEAAREKARDREEKLSSVRAAEKDLKTELEEKIQLKQEEAAKRHREKLERVRVKAFELSVQRCSTDDGVPKLRPYESRKKCGLCHVLINSEVQLHSHLRGKMHRKNLSEETEGRKLSGEEIQSLNLRNIVDASSDEKDPKTIKAKEREKAMRKRVKKIRARMAARAAEYERCLVPPTKFDSPNRGRIGRSLKEMEKVFSSQGKGAWPNNAVSALERAMGEICRSLDKGHSSDKTTFFALGGFATLSKVFALLSEQKSSCIIPLKSVATCAQAWTLACNGSCTNTEYVLKNNHLSMVADILIDRLDVLLPQQQENEYIKECPPQRGPHVDAVAKSLLALLSRASEDLTTALKEDGRGVDQSAPGDLSVRVQDHVSYLVSLGAIDRLASYLQGVQDPIDNLPEVGDFLLSCLDFMAAFAGVAEALYKPPTSPWSEPPDPTYMLCAYQSTDLAGLVSMLYGILLHQGAPSRCDERSPPELPSHTLAVATAAARLLARLASLHLRMFQEVLGQEGISLEFRHIASYLLWYCQGQQSELLDTTVQLVGYFAARHEDNQVIVQSGHQPSVLQQLCNMSFTYFSQPELKKVLFPTLLAACHGNRENLDILAEEMSYQLLEDFVESQDGKENRLVQLVLSES